jgi:hypothetical protein
VLVTSALSLAGATNAWTSKLDLSGNDMVVLGGNLANITNQLKSGYNAGHWNGASGIDSTLAGTSSGYLTALGSGPGGMTFDGVTTASTDVLVKYTYYGDATLDGDVDAADYTRIDGGYLAKSTGWSNGDFNYDGTINGSDYTLIDNAFNTQGAALTAQIARPTASIAAASAVPEPAGLLLCLIGGPLLGRRPNRWKIYEKQSH